MQSKEEYSRKRIHNSGLVWIKNFVTQNNCCLMMPNSYDRYEIFNPYLTTIIDSYIQTFAIEETYNKRTTFS